MGDITTNRLRASVSAAQRLQLALNDQMDYLDWEAYDEDIDLVWALLEECNDVLKPKLEALARERASTD